jgi:hypothetical protein
MRPNSNDLADYEQLKARLERVGLVIPGTIRETFLYCGKSTCACAAKGGAAHGPYYLWNRKMSGKLTSKSIPKTKLSLYEGWIANRRELESIVEKMLVFGAQFATNIPLEDDPGNSIRRASAKRGK